MKNTLLNHFTRYPNMTLVDAIKLIHQSEFAGGHLIQDEKKAFEYLMSEINSLEGSQPIEPMVEAIDDDASMVRVYLRPFLVQGLKPFLLHQAFCESAKTNHGSLSGFEHKIKELKDLIIQNKLPLSLQEFDQFLLENDIKSMPLYRHSPLYRESYKPHYRVVKRQIFEQYYQDDFTDN